MRFSAAFHPHIEYYWVRFCIDLAVPHVNGTPWLENENVFALDKTILK